MKQSLTALCFIMSVAIVASMGCGPNPSGNAAPNSQPSTRSTRATIPRPTAEGQPYDFYLLNLSWSPEFCATHGGSPECASHLGFVVHGLWPQNNDGSYPRHCASRPGPTSDQVWAGLMPTASLALHEWQTHGTCTPYDADTYFSLVRKVFGEVHIPPDFTSTTQQTMEKPAAIISDFVQANGSYPAGSIALSCGNNRLTAIEVCFDKSLNPIACSNVRTCRANVVKITAQNAAQ